MDNGVSLTAGGLSYLHSATDLHEVAAIGGRLYAYGGEEEFEPGYVMGWEVNNFMLVGGLGSILEGISDI